MLRFDDGRMGGGCPDEDRLASAFGTAMVGYKVYAMGGYDSGSTLLSSVECSI